MVGQEVKQILTLEKILKKNNCKKLKVFHKLEYDKYHEHQSDVTLLQSVVVDENCFH